MSSSAPFKIIDADGHIFEDMGAIRKRLPSSWRETQVDRMGIFPDLDHLHVHASRTPMRAFTDPGGPAGWLRSMDEIGIDCAILYPSTALSYGRIVDIDHAIEVTRAYNDWLAETYLAHSNRFNAMGIIPLQEPATACTELRRIVGDLHMRGAVLPSTGLSMQLGAPLYWPVYAEADRLGCAIAVHGGGHAGLGLDTMNVFAGTHALGHPFGIAVAFVGMLMNGVFDRFPHARYGFLEAGVGWFLLALERSDSSYRSFTPVDPRGQTLRLQAGESVCDYIRRHVADGRIFIGIEGAEPDLPHTLRRIGHCGFMFSSDFPHEVNLRMYRQALQRLTESRDLSDADKRAIFSGNATRFYRL